MVTRAIITAILVISGCLIEQSEQASCGVDYFCQNGGTCADNGAGLACCQCPSGYSGTGCAHADSSAVVCVSCSNGESACQCTDGTVNTESKCKCFPSSATVLALDDDSNELIGKRMDEISIGDKVLSVDPTDHAVKYKHVYGFGHSDGQRVVDDYQNIKTSGSSGEGTITASMGHLIWAAAAGGGGDFHLVRAGDVRAGDLVMVDSYNPIEGGTVRATVVNATFTSRDTGVYNPHVMGGNIIVNGVASSCYSDALPPHLSHLLLWPARQSFYLLGGDTLWFRYLDTAVFTKIIDVGRPFVEMMHSE